MLKPVVNCVGCFGVVFAAVAKAAAEGEYCNGEGGWRGCHTHAQPSYLPLTPSNGYEVKMDGCCLNIFGAQILGTHERYAIQKWEGRDKK